MPKKPYLVSTEDGGDRLATPEEAAMIDLLRSEPCPAPIYPEA